MNTAKRCKHSFSALLDRLFARYIQRKRLSRSASRSNLRRNFAQLLDIPRSQRDRRSCLCQLQRTSAPNPL